jgi:hypothetical protein
MSVQGPPPGAPTSTASCSSKKSAKKAAKSAKRQPKQPAPKRAFAGGKILPEDSRILLQEAAGNWANMVLGSGLMHPALASALLDDWKVLDMLEVWETTLIA